MYPKNKNKNPNRKRVNATAYILLHISLQLLTKCIEIMISTLEILTTVHFMGLIKLVCNMVSIINTTLNTKKKKKQKKTKKNKNKKKQKQKIIKS